jgi:hypothetical protein
VDLNKEEIMRRQSSGVWSDYNIWQNSIGGGGGESSCKSTATTIEKLKEKASDRD